MKIEVVIIRIARSKKTMRIIMVAIAIIILFHITPYLIEYKDNVSSYINAKLEQVKQTQTEEF